MKILHISDTHGRPPVPDDFEFDVVVHSGDFLPNSAAAPPHGQRRSSIVEEAFQTQWLLDSVDRFPSIYRRKPWLLTPGNHDYIDAAKVLRGCGLRAQQLIGPLTFEGVRFYGHPWTKERSGRWNWKAKDEREMWWHLEPAVRELGPGGVGIDVFVSHGPMANVLDRTIDPYDGSVTSEGCPVLREVLQEAKRPPKWLLHGHIHDDPGFEIFATLGGVINVSNAAGTQRIIEVEVRNSERVAA